jgi:hypothetical protein
MGYFSGAGRNEPAMANVRVTNIVEGLVGCGFSLAENFDNLFAG